MSKELPFLLYQILNTNGMEYPLPPPKTLSPCSKILQDCSIYSCFILLLY